jgi:hypothetical protein
MISGITRLGHLDLVNGVKVWRNGPDLAGGWDVGITYKNNTSKTVKYITYYLIPYNPVGDVVGNTIVLKLTGPINPNNFGEVNFEGVSYNNTLSKVVLEKATVEYMDGTKETLSQAELIRNISELNKNRKASATGNSILAILAIIALVAICRFLVVMLQ